MLVAGDRWRFVHFSEHLGRGGEGTGSILGRSWWGAGLNERQMRVVPTQLFSQSRSKARRTGRSTGNLRWVLPLFAVARRQAPAWKCLRWGTNFKTISKIKFEAVLDAQFGQKIGRKWKTWISPSFSRGIVNDVETRHLAQTKYKHRETGLARFPSSWGNNKEGQGKKNKKLKYSLMYL